MFIQSDVIGFRFVEKYMYETYDLGPPSYSRQLEEEILRSYWGNSHNTSRCLAQIWQQPFSTTVEYTLHIVAWHLSERSLDWNFYIVHLLRFLHYCVHQFMHDNIAQLLLPLMRPDILIYWKTLLLSMTSVGNFLLQ